MTTKKQVFSNLIWRFAERVGAQLVQFTVSIILARILMPEEYGTVALVTVFIAILQVFVDSGLGNALIQKKNADRLDFSTVFFTNIVFCVVLYGLLFFCAPLVATFYSNDSLVPLIRVLGITILVSGVKNVQQAYVSRKLMFKKFFFATLAGTIGAAVVGICMAYNGFGVWAIVAQQLFNVIVDTIVLWVTVKWRPRLEFSFMRLKGLFSFGWKLLASSIIDTTYQNLRQLLIGKFYSSADLAYFNRGKQIPNLAVENINKSIDSVLLPVLSREQDSRERVKTMTKRSIKVSVYIMAPIMMGLVFTSNNLVEFLLTNKWLPAVPYLCIFSIAFMFYPIHTANLNAIKAMGRSDLFLKQEILKKIVGIVFLAISVPIGMEAIAISLLVVEFIAQLINAWPNKKLINYGYLEQLKDIFPSIALAVLMGGVVFLINFLPVPSGFVKLLLQLIIGIGFYILESHIVKIDTWKYVKEIARDMFSREKKLGNS